MKVLLKYTSARDAGERPCYLLFCHSLHGSHREGGLEGTVEWEMGRVKDEKGILMWRMGNVCILKGFSREKCG